MEEKKWCCMGCGWTTTDNTLSSCSVCTDTLIYIPKRLDVALAVAVIEMQWNVKIDAFLNHNEDAFELQDIGTGAVLYTIRNWEDFKYFFGNYWYNRHFA